MAATAHTDEEPLATPEAVTVFRAFERDEFLEWPAWDRLQRILRANGGSYGLAGPRGAGKSWLMLRAIEWAEDPADGGRAPGIGLWYPSPSEYDPLAFIASLSDSLAGRIEWWHAHNPEVRKRMAQTRIAAVITCVVVGIATSFALVLVDWNEVVGSIAALAAAAAGAAVAWLIGRVLRSLTPEDRLLRDARLVREHARYTATRRESTELGGEAGRAGLLTRARRLRERELVERPATLSSLVNDFRSLAEEAGRVTGGLVIAIDELDKMSNPTKVRALLRDIKAIFEVPRVHFLVSVSDEAARNLSLGVLSERNEFSSSFYTVVEAQPATPQDCAELLERRGSVPREVSLVLAVLAGGNPREVVRLAELAGAVTTAREAAMAALREEALGLRRAIVTTVSVRNRPVGQQAREGAFLALPETAFEQPDEFSKLCGSALEPRLWDPSWKDPGWTAEFEESWRRLMVRLAVAGRLAAARSIVRETDLTDQLLDVITAAGQSAQVAKLVLDRNLRIESRRPPVDAPTEEELRERFMEIAGRYETTRDSMDFSPDRTKALDAIAQEARRLARQSPYSQRDIEQLLASERPGHRVVGLAILQGTADPAAYAPVMAAVRRSPTAFEGYQALRALESLRPTLVAEQRHEVEQLLRDDKWRASLDDDRPRLRLADRILKAIEHEPVK